MGHYHSVDDSFGYIEPHALGPLFARVDGVEELDAGRNILEVGEILPCFVIHGYLGRRTLFIKAVSCGFYTFRWLRIVTGVHVYSPFNDNEGPASSSCFLSATLYPLDELKSSAE